MRGYGHDEQSVEILSPGEADPWSRARGPADYLRDYTAGMSHEQRLAQVKWLANMMDDAFRIPGTPLRFGCDSVLGLFPGLGDVLTSALSLLIVHHAWQTGASKSRSPACSAMSASIS